MSVYDEGSTSDKTAEIVSLPISSSELVATKGYGCKNPIPPLVSSIVREGARVQ
jgi:hypothetical protein